MQQKIKIKKHKNQQTKAIRQKTNGIKNKYDLTKTKAKKIKQMQ